MQLQQKNNLRGCNTRLLLLPIMGALFLKKPYQSKPSEESTLDFHLTVIKKIDELLQDHDKELPVNASAPMDTLHVAPRSSPVELRPQLGKRVDHVEVDLPHLQQLSITKNRIIPEEFKIDQTLGVEPEFRFITSLNSLGNALHITANQQPRIEVIDLGDFTTDEISSHLKIPTTFDTQPPKQKTKINKQQSINTKPSQTTKIEIIDTGTFIQQASEDIFLTALKQNEEIEKKSQIYYLKAAGHKDDKIKKKDVEQSYVPDDFDQRLKILREKQQQEEEQKRELEEKLRKQREKEEQQKRELEEKEKKQLEKEQEKLAKQESKKVKIEDKKPQEEKKEQKKEVIEPSPEVVTKKQLKEQQRLERVAARKAKIEERLKIKKEKKLLKEQQKHLAFAKGDKKGKYAAASTELDSDVKKILQITDALLGELPEEVINRFMQTDDFELYEHILNKYKIR